MRSLVPLFVLVAACGQGGAQGGGGGGGGGRRELRYPVETARVEARRVEYVVRGVGSVEAFERVHVVARVAGVVDQVRFREGDEVKARQVLARIEPERYDIAVRAARAALARAQAAEAEAVAGLERRETIVAERPDLIPAEEVEAWRTRAQTTGAEVAEARAALDQAELNHRHASPSAPVAGIIETRAVETGQYLEPGAPIATLVQRDPLLLRFQVAEREARSIERGMTASFTTAGRSSIPARITHVAQSANPGTRLVQITAEVQDPPASLRPGSFAEATVPVGARDAAAVVPQIAIRASERGFLAYAVEGDIVRERVLELGMRTNDGLVEVRSGLQPGERIVTRGGEALSDGAKVTVKDAGARGAPVDGAGAGLDGAGAPSTAGGGAPGGQAASAAPAAQGAGGGGGGPAKEAGR